MRIEDFDYELPEELIAQVPLGQRDSCRLMVLDRSKKTVEHRHFYDILDYVNPRDCLVLNDSRVIPARVFSTAFSISGSAGIAGFTVLSEHDRMPTHAAKAAKRILNLFICRCLV